MYKNILLAIHRNNEASCSKPLLAAGELARTFGARLHVLTVVREVEAILLAKTATLGYELVAADLEDRLAALIHKANASDLIPIFSSGTAPAFMRRFWRLPGKVAPTSSSDRTGRP